MATRLITWRADDESGEQRFEQVRVEDDLGALRARGTILVAAGVLVGPEGPYRVDYELDTDRDLATHRLLVRVEGAGWRRELWLRRDGEDTWTVRRVTEPDVHEPAIADVGLLTGAKDCDLVSSALFNTPPVRRSGLHERPGTERFLMAWVSIPDLTVTPSHQTYGHVRPGVVSFDSEGGSTAGIDVDGDGFVTRYPAVAQRV